MLKRNQHQSRCRGAAKSRLLLLLFTVALLVPFSGIGQTITLTGDHITLEKVFAEVKKQANFSIVFNPKLVNLSAKVSLKAFKQPIAAFMDDVLVNQPYSYYMVGSNIIIFPKSPAKEIPDSTKPSRRDLSGFVYTQIGGTPVEGVSILVSGTLKATQTDENGKFQLKDVGENVALVFTSIGYEKKVVNAGKGDLVLYVSLNVALNELDQAVVQAYGITSKRLATGNIAKVSGEDIRKQPLMNPMAALQGRVAGLVITPVSGASSAPVKVEIRGKNSLNPNTLSEPLYVIDGIPQTVLEVSGSTRYAQGVSSGVIQGGASFTKGQSPFFGLNPRDIESIEVLKDADATAIYGSRAANGVILITTRKAKPGKTAFNLNFEQGAVVVPKYPEMMNTRQYFDMRREALKNDGFTPSASNAPDLVLWDTTRYTNWVKELLGTGRHTSVSAGLSGGDNKTSFLISSNYTNRVDLLSRDGGNKVGSFRFSVIHTSLNQKLSVSLMGGYISSKVDAILDKSEGYTQAPNAPAIFDNRGRLNYAEWVPAAPSFVFPFAYILQPNLVKTNNLTSNLTISYVLIKGLTISASGRFTNMNNSSTIFQPIASQNPQYNPRGLAIFGNTKNNTWAIEPQLQYTRYIGKGRLSVQVGGTTQTTTTRGSSVTGLNYTNDELLTSINNSGMQVATEGYSELKYASIFARINYNWDSKYTLNLNGRRDGSSRFAPGRQYGNFGSIGAAWTLSEEKWIASKLPSWITFVKLRGSYGVTGSDGIGDYQYLTRYSTTQPGSFQQMYTYNGIQPYVPIIPVNQDYRWEELRSMEGGLNLGFLDDRINVEFAWYRKRSGNQLTQLPTPSYTGFDNVVANWTALVQNSGVEVTFNGALIRKRDLSLSFSFNIASNRNKLISYPGIERSPYAFRYKVGQSLNMQYLLRYTGVDPLTGLYTFEDYNKDGVITQNSNVVPGTQNDDRYLSIDLNPKYQGGFGTDFSWKNYGISLYFVFINQVGLHPYTSVIPGRMNNLILPEDLIDNHWRKPGDNAKYARYSTSGSSFIGSSDRGYVNASYLRLNTVAFNYSIPEKLIKKVGLQSCYFSLRAQNVFTITRYNLDPEIQNGSFNPIPRTVVGSLSFNL